MLCRLSLRTYWFSRFAGECVLTLYDGEFIQRHLVESSGLLAWSSGWQISFRLLLLLDHRPFLLNLTLSLGSYFLGIAQFEAFNHNSLVSKLHLFEADFVTKGLCLYSGREARIIW